MKDISKSINNLVLQVLEGLNDPMVLSIDSKYCESVLEGAEVATDLIIAAATKQKHADISRLAFLFKNSIKQKSGHNLASLSKIKDEWNVLVDKVIAEGNQLFN